MSEITHATAGLATARLALQVTGSPHILYDLSLLPRADPLLKTAQARACPVTLTLPGRRLDHHDFMLTSLYQGDDAVIATGAAAEIELRCTWTRAPAEALRLLIQARAVEGGPLDGELALTMLEHLHPGPLDRAPTYDPGCGPMSMDGRPLLRAGRYALPRAWWSEQAGVAVLASLTTAVGEEQPWRWATPPETIALRLRAQWLDVCELTFMACEPGWHNMLAALREQLRAELDLGDYLRPDLAWYRGQWLQHFTFLYGREIFDHARGQLDIDRLLDDGGRFGGYDGVLLWPAYPRLGVDERGQWDFYDDVPGGRPALRTLATRARHRGTRVFIPYLPWDAPGECRHGEPPVAARELARVVADIDADGVFLDTIGAIPPQFRREIDRARAGVVFCAEMQPGPPSIAHITGSWDQAAHPYAAEVDLLRFLFPEHPRFVINRAAVGDHRQRVIARALFNGAGLVVWQDVFGEVLPYTDTEASAVRATVTALRRYADCFRGVEAVPLVPAAKSGVYANAFIAADGHAVMTVCNGGDTSVHGDLVAWTHDARRAWSRFEPGQGPGDDRAERHAAPHGNLEPGEVGIFVTRP